MLYRYLAFLVLFLSMPWMAVASKPVDVKNLSEDWLVYDPYYHTYVPYTGGNVTKLASFIDFSTLASYDLYFKASPGLSVFVNDQLLYFNNTSQTVSFQKRISDIDQLSSPGAKLLLFSHPKGDLPISDLKVITFVDDPVLSDRLLYKRGVSNEDHVFFMFFIIVVIFVSFKNTYPKRLSEMFSFVIGSHVRSLSDDSGGMYSFSGPSSFLSILLNTLCILLFLLVMSFSGVDLGLLDDSLIGIISLAGIIFFFHYIKYIYLMICGWIFNCLHLSQMHFFEFLRTSFAVNIVVAPVVMILAISKVVDLQFSYMHFLYIIYASLAFVLLRLIFLIFQKSDFRNIYLFSYLCIAEILPLAVLLTFVL